MVIVFIIGFLASLASVILYERGKRPSLGIELGSTRDDQKQGITPYRFVHVAVENKPVWWPLKFITDRAVAYACQAMIGVHLQTTKKRAIAQDILARWSGTPELVQTVAIPTAAGAVMLQIPDITKLPQGRKTDIFPSYKEEIPIAIKFDGDPECYIFSNESYLVPNPLPHKPWRNPNWKLDVGTYDILVKVFSGSITKSKRFILENRGPRREDMVLKPADK
ncbi:hypothetical protein M1N20_00090 [Dehalococcoidia bacterium]|nr:hypothetical protein [Dehalococcoidia bacterium]